MLLRWSRPANLILRHRKAKQKMNSTPSSSRNKLSSASLERYIRAAYYLAGAQIYLRENALLREPLRADQVKDWLLGHWGTCPGINLVYAHLNRVILRDDLDAMLITGPGHGAPANLANLYLQSSLSEFYPELRHDAVGGGKIRARVFVAGRCRVVARSETRATSAYFATVSRIRPIFSIKVGTSPPTNCANASNVLRASPTG